MRKLLLIAICFAVPLMYSGIAYGFHDEGVARCSGCHTMHNSQNGKLVDTLHASGNAYLLIRAKASDVCLTCHATSSGAVFGTDPLNPPAEKGPGNFVFLLEDNIYDGRSGTVPGSAAGHNIDAPSKGVGPDATLLTAPGGNFPSSAMGCSSCHDPHGNTNYRMLYGAGGNVQDGIATFANAAPTAVGLGFSAAAENNANHVAYQGGFSAWCANCHGNFHQEAGGRLEHPSGENLGGTIAGNYGRYNGTAHYNSGTPATSYLAAVPFEDAANTITSTAGPSASSQVSCITCHRAHATSAPDAGRWDFNVTWLSDDGVKSGSYAIPNPYGPDVQIQRSLCNKCHVKDAGDNGSNP
jgi:predicted CXXCH cytochrome family protein